MSDSEAPAAPARPAARRMRRKMLCLEAAVVIALVLSICTLLYVLSLDVAKAAGLH
ncbi:MAG: hypothetical protein IT539_02000 [Bradyrhizobiaceae bacterium]|nr:hypothetical protein [Bradyrhizobiaceae bacterium]